MANLSRSLEKLNGQRYRRVSNMSISLNTSYQISEHYKKVGNKLILWVGLEGLDTVLNQVHL